MIRVVVIAATPHTYDNEDDKYKRDRRITDDQG
jgi:hypothetical protein